MIKVMTATKRIGKIQPGEKFVRVSGKHNPLIHAVARRQGISVEEWFTQLMREMLHTLRPGKNERLARGTGE